MSIRDIRADANGDPLDEDTAALIKGMLLRGDRQSDIAACFLTNGGRVSEINTGQRFQHVKAAKELPPPGPYLSPFQLWKAKRGLSRLQQALAEAEDALNAVGNIIGEAERDL